MTNENKTNTTRRVRRFAIKGISLRIWSIVGTFLGVVFVLSRVEPLPLGEPITTDVLLAEWLLPCMIIPTIGWVVGLLVGLVFNWFLSSCDLGGVSVVEEDDE